MKIAAAAVVAFSLASCSFGEGMLMGLSSLGTPMGSMASVGALGGYSMPVSSVGGYSSGSSSSSSSSSSGSSSSERFCRLCVGSGKCRTCNGKGRYYDTSFGVSKWIDCPNCSDGRCTSCGGSGKR